MKLKDVAEQNIITVLEKELSFFENFTKEYAISWTAEEKKNLILPLSKSYVGYINTPVRTISLKPKYSEIGFEHIFRMYLYVYGYRPTDSASVLDISDSHESTDVAEMFLKCLKRNVQEGIIRTYQKTEVRTVALRGRVDYLLTYYNSIMNKRKPVSSVISSLSMENDYNNLILTALNKLKHTQKYNSVALELSMYFEGAIPNVKNGSVLLENINFNSNTARFRRTLTYAAMIIDQLSYSDMGSVVGTDSFLINFDRLFEDFVAKVLKEVPEKKEFSTWENKQKFADVTNDIGYIEHREYQPDLVYRYIDENPEHDYLPSAYAVLDVKNKAYGVFKNADVYQILTYTKLLFAKKQILLYPSFYKRMPEKLSLDQRIFSPAEIDACFINIADMNGEEFLGSIRWFADTVLKTIMDIPVR